MRNWVTEPPLNFNRRRDIPYHWQRTAGRGRDGAAVCRHRTGPHRRWAHRAADSGKPGQGRAGVAAERIRTSYDFAQPFPRHPTTRPCDTTLRWATVTRAIDTVI